MTNPADRNTGVRHSPHATHNQPPLLEGERLRRLADDETVLLDDVSLTVAGGESVGIVGPPGAGKTLLLRALALLDPLDGGEVRFCGNSVDADAVPGFRRRVLYVQQRPTMVDGTVHDNLLLPFSFRSAATGTFELPRVESWLDAVGRDVRFLNRSVADLSGGESQLVSLLRALQLDPTVLLLDEPTSSLDEQTRSHVERLLSDWLHDSWEGEAPAEPSAQDGDGVNASGRGMLIVTHDPSQAERMSDRLVRLESGRLVEGGGET